MHGVREALLDQQAEALGLRCWKVPIPSPCPNEVYEREMARVLGELQQLGVTAVVFGDLFLEDIRRYRETRLAEVGMRGIFPLWGRQTGALAREMIEVGIRATLTCIDPRKLDRSFAGRSFDAALLDGAARGRRPVRRERRVSHVHVGRADVQRTDPHRGRRGGRARRVRLRGPALRAQHEHEHEHEREDTEERARRTSTSDTITITSTCTPGQSRARARERVRARVAVHAHDYERRGRVAENEHGCSTPQHNTLATRSGLSDEGLCE